MDREKFRKLLANPDLVFRYWIVYPLILFFIFLFTLGPRTFILIRKKPVSIFYFFLLYLYCLLLYRLSLGDLSKNEYLEKLKKRKRDKYNRF